jgi:hypothetical protein
VEGGKLGRKRYMKLHVVQKKFVKRRGDKYRIAAKRHKKRKRKNEKKSHAKRTANLREKEKSHAKAQSRKAGKKVIGGKSVTTFALNKALRNQLERDVTPFGPFSDCQKGLRTGTGNVFT